MRQCACLVALVASLFLFGCSGARQQGAKAPETDPWADYKGTYATGVPSTAEIKQAEAKEKGAGTTTTTGADTKADAKADTKPAKTADTKPAKEAKPAKTAEPKTAELKPDTSANDARAMYGVGGGETTDEPAAEAAPAPKKVAKKKKPAAPVSPASGKKPSGKKPGKRAMR
jgi:hypothetical protein